MGAVHGRSSTTGADLYATLRRTGREVIRPDGPEFRALPQVRILAKADGYRIVQSRASRKGMTSWEARRRAVTVELTQIGSDLIAAPDAEEATA